MKLFFMALYILAAAVNVISCAANRQTPRRVSKTLLMPALAGAYIFAVESPAALVLAGLALGWIGDLFLIRPNEKLRQSAGIASFLLGHLCYIAAMLVYRAPAPGAGRLAAAVCACAVLGVCVYRFLRRTMAPDMRMPCMLYITVLCSVIAVGASCLLSARPGGWALLAGGLLFILSDTVLCYQMFNAGDPAPRYDTVVMSTYIAAQACLIAGFAAGA